MKNSARRAWSAARGRIEFASLQRDRLRALTPKPALEISLWQVLSLWRGNEGGGDVRDGTRQDVWDGRGQI